MSSTGKKIYKVRLEPDERKHLKEILDSGKGSKERRRRAHILLLADESRPDGGLSDGAIAEVLEIGTATIERVRKQAVMEGLEAALERKVQVNRKKRLLDGEGEAKLTMLACSKPPPGHARWSLYVAVVFMLRWLKSVRLNSDIVGFSATFYLQRCPYSMAGSPAMAAPPSSGLFCLPPSVRPTRPIRD